MVDANEFVKLQQGQKDEQDFKLATVVELFETGTAKITFFGEEAPSEKEYSYLASYKPTVGDTVLVVPFADTYIIAGKVLFKATIESPITQTELTEILNGYVETIDLADYALKTDLNNYMKDGDTIDSLFARYIKTSGTVAAEQFRHGSSANSSIAFFGGSMVLKSIVNNIASSATTDQVRTALINLITALKYYNLV